MKEMNYECTVHIWNKLKPNYLANSFVNQNGTNQMTFDNLGDAVTFVYNYDEPGVCSTAIRDSSGKEIPPDEIFARLLKSLFG